MLETIHTFASEQLASLRGADSVRLAHAQHYLALVCELEPRLRGGSQAETIARHTEELANLRAALDVLHADGEPEAEAAFVGACAYCWYMSGQIAEGRDRALGAYARVRERNGPERAWVANALALLSFMSGDPEATGRYAAEALDLAREHGDVEATMRALVGRTTVLPYEEGAATMRELIELARTVGDDWYLSLGLGNLAVCERELGHLEQAAARFEEALSIAQRIDDAQLTAGCLCNLAYTERRLSRFEAAEAHFRLALEAIAEQQLPEMVIWCFDGLASVSTALGTAETGALLLGAAERVAAATGYAHPQTREALEQTRATLESVLGVDRLAELLTRGEALDEDAALALARGLDAGPLPP